MRFNAANVNRKSAPTATATTMDDGSYEVTTLVGENSVSLAGVARPKDSGREYFQQAGVGHRWPSMVVARPDGLGPAGEGGGLIGRGRVEPAAAGEPGRLADDQRGEVGEAGAFGSGPRAG